MRFWIQYARSNRTSKGILEVEVAMAVAMSPVVEIEDVDVVRVEEAVAEEEAGAKVFTKSFSRDKIIQNQIRALVKSFY